MNCPNCQQPLREGALFCTRCGARTSQGGGATAGGAQTAGDASQPTVVGAGDVPAAPDPFVGRVLEGKYEIVAPLGAGGMGAVYLARRVLIGDEVAVKVLHSKFTGDEKLVERFRREARAAAQLHHPNVVTIHDYGEARGPDGFAYIVMELVRGESLRELLKREGRLDARRAVSLMRGVCAGVGAAHRRGIVHRDIKPDNVIVSPADDDDNTAERVKVVDFGIAKIRDMAAQSTLTEAGSMVGTLFYMSPEQCKGEPLDSRADVYSLGAMLYEMLGGSPPFTAPSITSIILKHVNAPPPPLPEEASVPPTLAAAVMRALAKEPDERPRDATEFAREIQAALASDAPAASAQSVGASTQPAEVSTQSAEPFFPATARPVPVTPTHAAPAHPTPSTSPPPTTPPDATEQDEVTVVRDSSAPPARRPSAYPPAQRPSGYAPTHQPAPPHTQTPAPPYAAPARRSRRSYAVGLLVVLLAILCGLAGVVGVLLYMRRDTRRPPVANVRPTPAPTATATPSFASPTPTPTPVDVAEVSKEVGDALEEWADSTRERKIDEHMSHYADKLETYYKKQNVPAWQVRADRQEAFVRYDDMKVTLDNIEITPDATGNRATATFDKTWEFDSPDKNSKGSVRQQLTLVRDGTRWLIVGEKDLQVYYTNSEDYTQ